MKRVLAFVCCAVFLAGPPARALPEAGWIPGNAGVMWAGGPGIPAQPPGSASLWLTRRIVTAPFAPDVQHMGSLLHGMYVSVGGGAWASLTPGCLLPEASPLPGNGDAWRATRAIAIAVSGLSECGIEGIAHDPLIPGRLYISTYDISTVSGGGATIGEGGIYVSDDAGVHWRRLYDGIRGNGIAVGRPSPLAATIVAGAIQRHNGDVGSTPGGGSLIVSADEGRTWRAVTLPPSGCGTVVETSQRVTPTIRFNPDDPRIVYAGTNAGLYVSTDAGTTWSLARQACGGTWGIAVTRDGDDVYIGDHAGSVWRTTRSATGFTRLTDVGGGKIQDLILDPVDERHLYSSVWFGGSLGVTRIDRTSGATRRLGDALLGPADQALPPQIPRPFPLTPGPSGNAPSLFLAHPPGRLEVSTVLRGTFWRAE